ncbi:dTDP-4-dehydrorhamnose 3,5-epimerase family protein, partial [Rhodococcus fascians]|nr:dTDP-4-dehydrorhamnose 3,5-epimerase family protein [Rhodococcus fascians]MBY3998649.1 dTDP-4-dehydrorhamnose 3,5-epimerase family protein [Rhodococcus fascians]
MTFRELKISGAYEYTPRQFGDDRGVFFEWFKASLFEETTGRALDLKQANCSVSAAGVLRGIHFTTNPPGQAKYVTCARGAFLDVIVDLRVGSPTFGQWD